MSFRKQLGLIGLALAVSIFLTSILLSKTQSTKLPPYPLIGGHCSGTVIAKNMILTAAHCMIVPSFNLETLQIEESPMSIGDSISVSLGDSVFSGKAFAIGSTVDSDLALIVGDFTAFDTVAVGDKAASPQEEVTVSGHPLGVPPIVTAHFTYTSIMKFGGVTMDLYWGQACGGFSGSSLQNSSGEIVGVLTQGAQGCPITLGVTLDKVRSFLVENGIL